jgi:hypothetical protein
MDLQANTDYFEMSFTLPNISLETCFYTLLDFVEIVDASEGYALIRTTEKVAHTILMSSLGSVFMKKVVLTPDTPCEVDIKHLELPSPVRSRRSKKDRK